MHTKNLLELVDAGIPCSTSFPEYIIAKEEIEEGERAETEGGTTGCEAHSTTKITWGDVYEGRVKLSDIFYPWGYFPKIPKK